MSDDPKVFVEQAYQHIDSGNLLVAHQADSFERYAHLLDDDKLKHASRNWPHNRPREVVMRVIRERSDEILKDAANASAALQKRVADLTGELVIHSNKSKELLTSVDTLIQKWDRENEATKGKVKALNYGLAGLSLFSFGVAAAAFFISCEALSLQRQSLEMDQKSLKLQEEEAERTQNDPRAASAMPTKVPHDQASSGAIGKTPAVNHTAPDSGTPAGIATPPVTPVPTPAPPLPDAPKPDA